mmetsp:Transcript_30730/g.99392  ORF Transcript_30730/g.99392 Transcript_30730/m.99392 type:complete len:213 (-) Transcript_30730:98-736(-)
MSATVKVSSQGAFGGRTVPSCGCSVVNGYGAICGSALEIAASNEDFPALGKPTSPMSATSLSVRRMVACSPGMPSSASLELCNRPARKATFPRPPVPPPATSASSPSRRRSASRVGLALSTSATGTSARVGGPKHCTVVPHGTVMMASRPRRPFIWLPLPCAPEPARKECCPMVRSPTCLLARTYTLPPVPPLPPSGGPRSTRVSRKKLAHP